MKLVRLMNRLSHYSFESFSPDDSFSTGAFEDHRRRWIPKKRLPSLSMLKTVTKTEPKLPYNLSSLQFGNTTALDTIPEEVREAKDKLTKQNSLKPLSLGRRLFNVFLSISPLANLTGGLCLITGASLPKIYQVTQPHSSNAETIQKTDSFNTNLTSADQLPKAWEEMRKSLIQMGWTITSLSAMVGNFNGIALGMTYKQPSMVLSALGGMAICPFLMMDPSVSVRTAMMLLGAPWLAGLANRFRNDSAKQKDPNAPAPLEYDMTHLWKPDELRAWGKAHNIEGNTVKLWGRYAAQGVGMIAKDQIRLFEKIGKNIGQLFPNKLTEQNQDAVAESKKASILLNSELHSRVGGVFYILGGVPMLVLGGDAPLVNAIGSKLIGTAGFLGDSALFFKAVREKDGKLLVGIPLRNLGGAWFHTDLGAGVSFVGRSIIQQHFRKEVMAHQQDASNPSAEKPSAAIVSK